MRLTGSSFTRPKPLLLLTYLALEGPQPRHHLAELFFPDASDAKDALATTLRRLKEVTHGVRLEDGLLSCSLSCDASKVLHHLDAGQLSDALELYNAPFLQGLGSSLPVELEEWVYATREYLAGRVRYAHLQVADQALAEGKHAQAASHAEAAYSQAGASLLEPVVMVRLYALLRATRSPRTTELQEEARQLGIELEPDAAGLIPAAVIPSEPGTEPSPPTPQHNLPVPLTPLVGRDLELVELAEALADPGCRLLTLHGPGGVGKTRLALQVAFEQVKESPGFPGGVHFVSLDALSHPSQLPNAIAAALHQPPVLAADPWQELAQRLKGKRALLLLDNFEHLMAAAPHLNTLLQGATELTLLLTSRERLNLTAEWLLTLTGLPIPGDDVNFEEALLVDAVKLFLQRAKRSNLTFSLSEPDLPHVLSICRQVDGFPLGIELAAASLRVTPLAELAKALAHSVTSLDTPLRDVAQRHRSLSATLEHSWRLLTPKEQGVLKELAVFQGGFRREAAAEVAGATIPTLVSLVDKSLLRSYPNGRFDRHVVFHQFVLEKLAQEPERERAAQQRHGAYYTRLLGATLAEMHGAAFQELFALLAEEEGNLLAYLSWAARTGHSDALALLSEPLLWYFAVSGRFLEGAGIFTNAMETLPSEDPASKRARASLLLSKAWLYRYAGDLDQALALSHSALAIARSGGSQVELIRGLDALSQIRFHAGHYHEARLYAAEGLGVAKAHGDKVRLNRMLVSLGFAEGALGNGEAAEAHVNEAWALFERGEIPRSVDVVATLICIGVIKIGRLKWQEASDALQLGVSMSKEAGYHGMLGMLSCTLSHALFEWAREEDDAERFSQARRCCYDALPLAEAQGENVNQTILYGVAGRLALRSNDADEALRFHRDGVRVAWASKNLQSLFWIMPGLVETYLALAQTAKAAILIGLIRQHHAAPSWTKELALRWQDEVALWLGADELKAYLEQGAALPLELAVYELTGLGQGVREA